MDSTDEEIYNALKEFIPLLDSDEKITYKDIRTKFLAIDTSKNKEVSGRKFTLLRQPYKINYVFLENQSRPNYIDDTTVFKLSAFAKRWMKDIEKELEKEAYEKQLKEEHREQLRISTRLMSIQVSDYDSQKKTTQISIRTAIASVVIALLSWGWSIYDTHIKSDKIDILTKENYSLRDTITFYKAIKHIANNPQPPRKDTIHK